MLLEKWEGGRGGSRIPSIDLENSFPPTQIWQYVFNVVLEVPREKLFC
jgi:hypothetical protein